MKQKTKEVVSLRLESPMVKRLKKDAKKDDRSLSYIVRSIINWYYRRNK